MIGPTQCYEPGCPNPPGGYRSPYWCEQHDRERIARIWASLDAIIRDMGACPSCGHPLDEHEDADG